MAGIQRVTTPFSYSAAVKAGDTVYLGLHRGFGDEFATQLRDALGHLQATLAQFDLTLEQLVKMQVWLKYVSDLPEMEKLFHEYFETDHFPARMTSTTEFFDTDCLLMLEGIAYAGQ